MQKKRSSKTLYEGTIFTVIKDEVEIKGCVYERDIIHHHGGVGVLAIKEDKILFVKQYRYAIGKHTLEVPAGKLEKGEDPYTCGLRELEEESGLTSPLLHQLCTLYSTPGFCNEKIYLYWTDQLTQVENPAPMDEDEDIEVLWIPIKEALDMVETGEIEDGKTIVAVQFAAIHFS